MDYQTARKFLISQVDTSGQDVNTFLSRLQQQKPPIPGQVTNILLALKIVSDGLHGASHLDRELVYALHLLSFEGRQQFEIGRRLGISWPPLLHEDLNRISRAVKSIFSGVWQGLTINN
jgi:hypothetical protein